MSARPDLFVSVCPSRSVRVHLPDPIWICLSLSNSFYFNLFTFLHLYSSYERQTSEPGSKKIFECWFSQIDFFPVKFCLDSYDLLMKSVSATHNSKKTRISLTHVCFPTRANMTQNLFDVRLHALLAYLLNVLCSTWRWFQSLFCRNIHIRIFNLHISFLFF